MTIVVHASDCKAIQCKPIDKQSALIVAIRPAQRNMIARLITALFDVNQGCNANSQPSQMSSGTQCELSRRSGGNKYFLSSRDAAKACPGLSHQAAWEINGALERLGVTKIVRVGDQHPNGAASEFRYPCLKAKMALRRTTEASRFRERPSPLARANDTPAESSPNVLEGKFGDRFNFHRMTVQVRQSWPQFL
jgi:hypothetical protein